MFSRQIQQTNHSIDANQTKNLNLSKQQRGSNLWFYQTSCTTLVMLNMFHSSIPGGVSPNMLRFYNQSLYILQKHMPSHRHPETSPAGWRSNVLWQEIAGSSTKTQTITKE